LKAATTFDIYAYHNLTVLLRAKLAHKDGRTFDIFNDLDLVNDIIGYTGENAKQLEIALEFLATWK
jgi:hypothetical protein